MKHLFLPYELAVVAKEKGFKIPQNETFARYTGISNRLTAIGNVNEDLEQAPLYQQIVDWFREIKNISIEYSTYSDKTIEVAIFLLPGLENRLSYRGDYYNALNKAIEEAFKLI